MTLFARLLVLVACGLTVLPAGWCCAAARWAATSTLTAPSSACCGCCPAEPPADAPPPARAWCCARDPADPPRPVEADAPDLTTVAVLTPFPHVLARTRILAADVVVPDDPLHVLHCVWLC